MIFACDNGDIKTCDSCCIKSKTVTIKFDPNYVSEPIDTIKLPSDKYEIESAMDGKKFLVKWDGVYIGSKYNNFFVLWGTQKYALDDVSFDNSSDAAKYAYKHFNAWKKANHLK